MKKDKPMTDEEALKKLDEGSNNAVQYYPELIDSTFKQIALLKENECIILQGKETLIGVSNVRYGVGANASFHAIVYDLNITRLTTNPFIEKEKEEKEIEDSFN